MTEAVFAGVARGGTFLPDLGAQWNIWHDYNDGKRVVAVLDLERQVRSLAQNRRYFKLVVPVAAEVLNQGREIPLSKDQVHEVLKGAFIGWEDTPLGKVPKSSRKLDTAEFAHFCQEAESWLLHTFGVVLGE